MTYDAENRLFSISKNGVTTKFLYDGANLIAEYDGGNALLRRYVHGPGSDNPLVWYEGSGTSSKSYLYTDERGSVTAVTDGSGSVTTVYGYDDYGVPSTLSGSANSRFRYTGQTWLPEVGLYYYKARMYAPSLGRFLQPDPIGYGDGMNMYAYVGGDPVNSMDPTGNCDEGMGSSVGSAPVNVTVCALSGDDGSGGGADTAGGTDNTHAALERSKEETTVVVVTARRKTCVTATNDSLKTIIVSLGQMDFLLSGATDSGVPDIDEPEEGKPYVPPKVLTGSTWTPRGTRYKPVVTTPNEPTEMGAGAALNLVPSMLGQYIDVEVQEYRAPPKNIVDWIMLRPGKVTHVWLTTNIGGEPVTRNIPPGKYHVQTIMPVGDPTIADDAEVRVCS